MTNLFVAATDLPIMQLPDTFSAFVVNRSHDAPATGSAAMVASRDLPPGNVVVQVQFSSLNYKDALAVTGHSGVVKAFPHIPGIDAVGVVVESKGAKFSPGQSVIVTGHELGADRWGGYAEFVRVPAEWVVPLPIGLTPRQSMILGTAGFTAAQSVDALIDQHITPDRGEVLVTGASGGVGSWAVAILTKLGYTVAAVTGKATAHDYLKSLGAKRILSRERLQDDGTQPLLKGQWAGAVDTVGGSILATIIRGLKHRGCATACGLTAGAELPLNVFPFILRGVRLIGIDSAWCPYDKRIEMWDRLATDWKTELFDALATRTINLSQIDSTVREMLDGRVVGRVLVQPRTS